MKISGAIVRRKPLHVMAKVQIEVAIAPISEEEADLLWRFLARQPGVVIADRYLFGTTKKIHRSHDGAALHLWSDDTHESHEKKMVDWLASLELAIREWQKNVWPVIDDVLTSPWIKGLQQRVKALEDDFEDAGEEATA